MHHTRAHTALPCSTAAPPRSPPPPGLTPPRPNTPVPSPLCHATISSAACPRASASTTHTAQYAGPQTRTGSNAVPHLRLQPPHHVRAQLRCSAALRAPVQTHPKHTTNSATHTAAAGRTPDTQCCVNESRGKCTGSRGAAAKKRSCAGGAAAAGQEQLRADARASARGAHSPCMTRRHQMTTPPLATLVMRSAQRTALATAAPLPTLASQSTPQDCHTHAKEAAGPRWGQQPRAQASRQAGSAARQPRVPVHTRGAAPRPPSRCLCNRARRASAPARGAARRTNPLCAK